MQGRELPGHHSYQCENKPPNTRVLHVLSFSANILMGLDLSVRFCDFRASAMKTTNGLTHAARHDRLWDAET